MTQPKPEPTSWFDVTPDQLRELFKSKSSPKRRNKTILFLIGTILTPITFIGAIVGFVRSYLKFKYPNREYPDLAPLLPIMRVAMILGAVLIWIAIFLLAFVLFKVLGGGKLFEAYAWFLYFGGNLLLTFIAYRVFRRWQIGINNLFVESDMHGTAHFATPEELQKYSGKQGFYLGGNYTFSDKGHILTTGSTRSGKGTNLICTNLLGLGGYKGSWVVIDPKGENCAISRRYQLENWQKVVVLNPWGLLEDQLGPAQRYNPLDILADQTNPNLVDDAMMVAEMIVPIDNNDRDRFFSDNARSVVCGLLLHLATIQPFEEGATSFINDGSMLDKFENRIPAPVLKTLWQWVRLGPKEWKKLLEDMRASDALYCREAVEQASKQIMKLMAAGDRTWGVIIAVILQCTDFIQSPALQESLQRGFDASTLSDGKTTLYVIIPVDKLQSHARWLRLVVTTTMRAVVRRPNRRVCFLLDEFSALGYLPEIEIALSTYAGFNITVWTILQSLVQLEAHYPKTWETFVGNSTIRHYLSVNDNFTAKYVSEAIGMTTHTIISRAWWGLITKTDQNQRELLTPDEVRRLSGDNILVFMGEAPVTYFAKKPYYAMSQVNSRASKNPYFST